jgi:hypothetical protein
LVPQDQRLSARELLRHPFLAYKSADPREHSYIALDEKVITSQPQPPPILPPIIETPTTSTTDIDGKGGDASKPEPPTPKRVTGVIPGTHTPVIGPPQPVPSPEIKEPQPGPDPVISSMVPAVMIGCDCVEEQVDGISVMLALNIHFERRRKKQIRFSFTWATDTPEQVAAEMAQALGLPEPEHSANLIARELQTTCTLHELCPLRRVRCLIIPPSFYV